MQSNTFSPSSVPWFSSYEENNYGDLFYSLVCLYKPQKVVELGTKGGYSAYHIAKALKVNGGGTLDCYDLWEDYTKNYGFDTTPKSIAEKKLEKFKKIVTLKTEDAFKVHKKYKTVDILHIDLDNNGDILERVIPEWIDKVRQLIIIEGGSKERDEIELPVDYRKMPIGDWIDGFNVKKANALKKIVKFKAGQDQFVVVGESYKPKPISSWINEFHKLHPNLKIFTFQPFPSLTLIGKK